MNDSQQAVCEALFGRRSFRRVGREVTLQLEQELAERGFVSTRRGKDSSRDPHWFRQDLALFIRAANGERAGLSLKFRQCGVPSGKVVVLLVVVREDESLGEDTLGSWPLLESAPCLDTAFWPNDAESRIEASLVQSRYFDTDGWKPRLRSVLRDFEALLER